MRCSACGHGNRETAAFCESCGSRLAPTCSHCAAELRLGARFCDACGHAQATPATPSAVPAPQSSAAEHLAEKILAGRAGLEGERKQVTVLFADIVGSTALIEGRDPEDAQRLLDGAITVMMDAVRRYEGTVSRLMGDGLMALFGAPVAHEDHAVRACYAALAMQEGIAGYAEQARQRDGVEVGLRIGLNSGEVVVRVIADDLHLDYTALGQAVHLAARMEEIAAPGSIRLTTETLRLAEGFVEARPLGPMAVKGLSEPVQVAELVGVGAVRTRFQASAARGLTPFTGREIETAVVREALERAGAGRGQVVALVGEPGVGKSRLVWEVTQAAAAQGWAVLQADAAAHATAVPYLPVIDLLKQHCGIEPHDDADAVGSKVRRRLLAFDPALEPVIPSLLSLLDVPVEDVAWQALDPPGRRRQTLDGVQRLLLRQSQHQPLLLVVEDLHWIDSESPALLDELVDALPTARILLLVNYRPEYTHTWGGKTYYTQLRIDPLTHVGAEAFLDALLGDDPTIRPLKPPLIERTDGNPFFLEESVRSLVETEVLGGERGAYRLCGPVEAVRVPATVQAVLAARIDRLPPADKRLLQTASVIGKDVALALLRAVAQMPADALRDGLARLQAAEFLYPVSLFPEPEYTFKHALTHEVAYGSLLQETRRVLHARIVDAVERLYADRLGEHVERLAHHALRGEEWERAVGYCQQAGRKAASRSALLEAATGFDQALVALEHVPATRGCREQAIDIRLDLRSALYPLRDFERIVARLREAAQIAEALDDSARLARVSAYLASVFFTTGRYAEAINSASHTSAIAEAVGDLGTRVLGNHYLGLAYHSLGDYDRAIALLDGNVLALSGDLTFERFGLHGVAGVFSRTPLVWSLAERSDFPTALARAREQTEVADAADHPYTVAAACMGVGGLHVLRGDVDSAITVAGRGVEVCRTWEIQTPLPISGAHLGYAHALAGRPDQGVGMLAEAVATADRIKTTMCHALSMAWLSEALLLAGRPAEALEQAERALTLARQRGERGALAWALRVRAEIAACDGRSGVDLAEAAYHEPLALAEELGMRPLQAHCHFGLGKLYRRIGRAEEAYAELTTTVEMLREMGMAFWLPEAEAELAATVH
jgi:class 3 adenylate cyclase/tetratricopeptide (TPR) repeat protein